MPVVECQSEGSPGWKYGDGGKCYTYEPGNEEDSNRAKHDAYIQGAAIEASSKGLYLVSPQARLIHSGFKTTIAKAKIDDDLIGTHRLVTKEDGTGYALGEITIGEPNQVSAVAFKDYHHTHQVSESDRMRWWQDTSPLFLYPVTNYKAFEEVISVVVPPGTQMIMDDLQVVVEDDKATYPMASADRTWDADAAISRIRRWADAEDEPNSKYATAFMYHDPDKPRNFTSYSFPFLDIVDGEPMVIPHALSNILSRLPGSTIPDTAKVEIRKRVADYQGEKEEHKCPECGAEIEEDATECSACGMSLDRALVSQESTRVAQQIKEESVIIEAPEGEKEENELDPSTPMPPESIKQSPIPEPSSGTYVLTQRLWAGSESATAGALGRSSKSTFDLFIKDPRHGVSRYTGGSPTNADRATVQVVEPAQVLTTDGRSIDVMTIPPDAQLDIKTSSLYNPGNTTATLSVIERGPVIVKSYHKDAREYEFGGKKVNGSWTVTMDNGSWTMERMTEDTKVGKRVQGAKLNVVRHISRRLKELAGSIAGEVAKPLDDFVSWAAHEDETVEDAMSRAPRSILDVIAGKKDWTPGAAFAFKALDGQTYWMQWTTNAFVDREREIFTTKALEDYVTRHDDDNPKGEFWFWHIKGTKFASVTWQAVVGRFLVQCGPFDDTPIGQAFKEFFLSYPDGHPEIAPYGWGTSHGYYYAPHDREDRIYEQFEIKESDGHSVAQGSEPTFASPEDI